MTERIYRLINEKIFPLGAMVDEIDQEWSTLNVMNVHDFEERTHEMCVLDKQEKERETDALQDLLSVHPGVWAISDRAWDWLPELKRSGCRVAENVRAKGAKRYKLIYPATVLDLLDHERSDFSWNDVTGTISWVRNCHAYEWAGELPLVFQMLFHNRKEYNGSMVRPSMQCFVSQAFADELERRHLTGVKLVLAPRTRRPAGLPEPKSVFAFVPELIS